MVVIVDKPIRYGTGDCRKKSQNGCGGRGRGWLGGNRGVNRGGAGASVGVETRGKRGELSWKA